MVGLVSLLANPGGHPSSRRMLNSLPDHPSLDLLPDLQKIRRYTCCWGQGNPLDMNAQCSVGECGASSDNPAAAFVQHDCLSLPSDAFLQAQPASDFEYLNVGKIFKYSLLALARRPFLSERASPALILQLCPKSINGDHIVNRERKDTILLKPNYSALRTAWYVSRLDTSTPLQESSGSPI